MYLVGQVYTPLASITKNAYIYVAVHDLAFCEGGKQAFELTLRNIGQVSVLTAGERLLLTFAKLAIACSFGTSSIRSKKNTRPSARSIR